MLVAMLTNVWNECAICLGDSTKLCQMIRFQKKLRPVSQMFLISPQDIHHYIPHPIRHQTSQIPSLSSEISTKISFFGYVIQE